MERRVTSDISTWSPHGRRCEYAVGKHYIDFKLGLCLIGPKIDVKSMKKAFIYRPCAVKLRRAVNFIFYLNRENTEEIIPVLVVF
jgi:hypothetical protein